MKTVRERVLEVVQSIPAGRVMTYGDIARTAGTGARVVGRILHNGGHDIPWWRVVNADGRPYRDAALDARAKFIEEATAMLDQGNDVQVDLAQASVGRLQT